MKGGDFIDSVCQTASRWNVESQKYLTFRQKAMSKEMNDLAKDPDAKHFIVRILDRSIRPSNSADTVDYIAHTIKKLGIPNSLCINKKIRLKLLLLTGKYLHFVITPLMRVYLKKYISPYVVFGSERKLHARISENAKYKIETNLNRIGESTGVDKAKKMLDYMSDIKNPNILCMSIKLSTISSISMVSLDETMDKLDAGLSKIFQAVKDNPYIEKGNKKYKLINLDMEEYVDLFITSEVFMRVLSKPEFKDITAGIALQAYIPDSHLVQQKITEWAKKRASSGGSPVRIRIVKGANSEMEAVDASEKCAPLATYSEKCMTDANYKKMVTYALKKDNIEAVNIGIASHNLFEISYAYHLAKQNAVLDKCKFEMLQGICDHVAQMLSKDYKMNVLLYTPFVSDTDDFLSSIAYMVRRFSENTSRDNYLKYIHDLSSPDSWQKISDQFKNSLLAIDKISNAPNRKQNRSTEIYDLKSLSFFDSKRYQSCANTDFSLVDNIRWAENVYDNWHNYANSDTFKKIPVVVGGNDITTERDTIKILDHNRSSDTGIEYNAADATKDDVDISIKTALTYNKWRSLDLKDRLSIMSKVSNIIREKRQLIMGALAFNTGKTITEADPEISEAVDFVEYYSYSYFKLKNELSGKLSMSPKGVSLVISPWNFPFAIPGGGIAASLIAGNNVIFKPSNLSILVGYELAKCFWEAGVPKEALQFIPTSNSEVSKYLSSKKELDLIIFTGSTATALSISKNNPNVYLAAETGGKNVTIATKFCDRDQVVKDVLHAAFSNAGQKCSSTSILALDEELYYDNIFLNKLVSGASAMRVGSAWDLSSKIGPLVKKPTGDLEWALTDIDPEEKWLLEPNRLNDRGTLWSPGIKIGTRFGSRSHMNEFFGPVLSIMRISSLEDGIRLANATGYGLTSGLASLDEREHDFWLKNIKCGNLYINRGTTGAIVMRQPFGGMGKSAFGSGIKAGGINYITQFVNFTEQTIDAVDLHEVDHPMIEFISKISSTDKLRKSDQMIRFIKNARNYIKSFYDYFSKEIDYANVHGQANITRFVPLDSIGIRIVKNDSISDILSMIFAAKICCKSITVSIEDDSGLRSSFGDLTKNDVLGHLFVGVKIAYEGDHSFVSSMTSFTRIKTSGKYVSEQITNAAAEYGIYVSKNPVLGSGRIDLLQYLQEQSISYNYHRYGYVEKQ